VTLAGGTAAFAVVNGLTEVWTLQSPTLRIIENGIPRAANIRDSTNGFVFGTLVSLPWGTTVTLVLAGLGFLVAKCFGHRSAGTKFLVAIALGPFVGASISMAVWIALGGWGPPFLIPAIVAGTIVFPAMTARERLSLMTEKDKIPLSQDRP
jgi:hypothetical protein